MSNDVGIRILNFRKKFNMSQKQLAEKLNVSNKTISKWELGNSSPDIESMKQLCKIFNITMDELVGNDITENKTEEISITSINKKSKKKIVLISFLVSGVILFITLLSFFLYFFIPREPIISSNGVLLIDKDKLTANCVVSNETKTFSFEDNLMISDKNKWSIYKDVSGLYEIKTNIVELNPGDNTFYIVVKNSAGKKQTYTINIRRRPIYTVVFMDGEEFIDIQEIEEDSFAIAPELTQIEGYTTTWDYDVSNPIKDNMIISKVVAANEYSIIYHYDEVDSQEPYIQKVKYKESFYIPFSISEYGFEERGYKVLNWNTSKDGTGIEYQLMEIVDTYNIIGDLHLYAEREIINYSIMYVYNRDKETLVKGSFKDSYTIEDEFELPKLEKIGCDFLGWKTNYSNQRIYTKIEKGTYGNLILDSSYEDAEKFSISSNFINSENLIGTDKYYEESDKSNLVINVNSANLKEESYFDKKYEVSSKSADFMFEKDVSGKNKVYYFGVQNVELENLAEQNDIIITYGNLNNFNNYPLRYKLIEDDDENGYIPGFNTYYCYSNLMPFKIDEYSSTVILYIIDDDITKEEQVIYDFLYITAISSQEYNNNKQNYAKVQLTDNSDEDDSYYKKLTFDSLSDLEFNNFKQTVLKKEGRFSNLCLKYDTNKINKYVVYVDNDDIDKINENNPNYKYLDLVKIVDVDANGFKSEEYHTISIDDYDYYVDGVVLYFKILEEYYQGVTNIEYDGEYEIKKTPNISQDSLYIKNILTGTFAIYLIDDCASANDKVNYIYRNFIVVSEDEFERDREFYCLIPETSVDYSLKYNLYYKYDVIYNTERIIYSKVDDNTYRFIDIMAEDYLASDYELILSSDPNYVDGLELYYKKIRKETYGNISENSYFYFKTDDFEMKSNSYYAIEFSVSTTENIQTSVYIEGLEGDEFAKIENISTDGEDKKYVIFISVSDAVFANINLSLGNKSSIAGDLNLQTISGSIDFDDINILKISENEFISKIILGKDLTSSTMVSFLI